MIFTFRIVSDEVNNFKREIKIDGDNTFFDLHTAICESVGYDKAELCSFFLCDDNWEKGKEITLEDMGADSADDIYLMDDCVLSDYIDDEGQRLIFTYDILNDRSFFIEMKKIETGKHLSEPFCSVSMGKAPQQIVEFEPFSATADTKTAAASVDDMEEDFYGTDEYNEDELDNFNDVTLED